MTLAARMLLRVAVLAGAAIFLMRMYHTASERSSSGQPMQVQLVSATNDVPATNSEPRDIYYNFPKTPAMQVLSIYEDLCGKKVQIQPGVHLSDIMHIVTAHRLTKTEAKRLLEQELEKQAHVKIIKSDDGNLSAVPALP
jgi:hypothetical protein